MFSSWSSRSRSTPRENRTFLDYDSSSRTRKDEPSRPDLTDNESSSSPWALAGAPSPSSSIHPRKKRTTIHHYEPSVSFNTCPLRNAMYLSGILEVMDTDSEAGLSTTPAHSLLTFPRRPVAPLEPKNSALTAAIVDHSLSASNPFQQFKTSAVPKKGQPCVNAQVHFPYAEQPVSQPMFLLLKEGATVRDLLGLALCTYYDRAWLPLISSASNHLSDWSVYLVNQDGYMNFQNEAPDITDRLELLSVEHIYAVIRTPSLGRHALKSVPDSTHKRHRSLLVTSKTRQSFWHGRALSLPGYTYHPPAEKKVSVTVLDVVSHEKQTASTPPETNLEISSQLQIKDLLRLACQVRGIPPSELNLKTYTLVAYDNVSGFKSLPRDLSLSESGYSVFILVKHKVKLA